MSGEEAGEASTLARLASSLWMAEASEVGLAAEPGTERTPSNETQKRKSKHLKSMLSSRQVQAEVNSEGKNALNTWPLKRKPN